MVLLDLLKRKKEYGKLSDHEKEILPLEIGILLFFLFMMLFAFMFQRMYIEYFKLITRCSAELTKNTTLNFNETLRQYGDALNNVYGKKP